MELQPLKFRSPTKEPVHVASLLGHIATVGPEWRELPPILHKIAISEGCITDNMVQASINAKQEGNNELDDPDFRILKAMADMVAEKNPEDFVKSGAPNLTKLSERVGMSVDRDDMNRLWSEYNKA